MQRLKNDECEDYRRNTSGCTQRIVLRIILLFKIGGYVRHDNGQEIQGYKIKSAGTTKKLVENPFDNGPKKVKGEHIKKKVNMVDVDEPRSEETVVLPVSFYPVRVHHQVSHQPFLIHGQQADQYSKSDDGVGDVHSVSKTKR